jgi:hypothetical protein
MVIVEAGQTTHPSWDEAASPKGGLIIRASQ